jgi:hypothetical protein
MLKEDAARLLRSSMNNVDEDIVTPVLQFVYDHNMLYDPDDSIKGDTQIVAKGMNAALQREGARQQHMAVLDLLGNPEDRALLGEDRRYAIIRNMLNTFEEIDTDEIIPTDDEIRHKLEQMAKQPPPPDPKLLQIEAKEREVMARLEWEREQFRMEQAAKAEQQAIDLQVAAADREVKLQVSKDDLDLKMQNEIIKLRAARQSAHEIGSMEMEKQQMKLEAEARMQVEKLRAELQLKRMAGGEKITEDTPENAEDVEAAIVRIMTPLLKDMKAETMDAIRTIASMVSTEAGMGDINVAVNLPDCAPGTKRVSTTRDAQGNLQAVITPEGEV